MSTLEMVVEIRKRTAWATQFTNIFFNFWENMRDFNFWKNIFWNSEKKIISFSGKKYFRILEKYNFVFWKK